MLLTEILAATRHYSAIGIDPCHEIVGEERVERRKSEGQVKIRVPVNFFIFVQSRTGHGNPQMEVGRVTVWEHNTRDLGIQCGDTSLPNATCLRAQSSAAHTNALDLCSTASVRLVPRLWPPPPYQRTYQKASSTHSRSASATASHSTTSCGRSIDSASTQTGGHVLSLSRGIALWGTHVQINMRFHRHSTSKFASSIFNPFSPPASKGGENNTKK